MERQFFIEWVIKNMPVPWKPGIIPRFRCYPVGFLFCAGVKSGCTALCFLPFTWEENQGTHVKWSSNNLQLITF